MFTHWPDIADSPEMAAATGLLRSVVAERYFEWLMGWLEVRDAEPAEWQRAAQFGDTFLYLTAEELEQLGRQQQELLDRFLDRLTRPELRPPGARRVAYLHLAFPDTHDPSSR
jgi:hypothetical protein